MNKYFGIIVVIVIIVGGFLLYRNSNQFSLPRGETTQLKEIDEVTMTSERATEKNLTTEARQSAREVFVTDGVKHSIPLNEILSGGVSKDGIPSIDKPKFINTKEADKFLPPDAVGLGLAYKGTVRFYPYQILVWHEIVNDNVSGNPILVTYCPLCATGIVFDAPRIDEMQMQFGVSGKLWKSNLLMYNRTGNSGTESLWSQVLGEAILGPLTGTRLSILPADTVQYGDWKRQYPDTMVLSTDTGEVRSYGRDPYGDYYTNDSVSFGATFNDDRLHPKAFVLGIEINGIFKAYHKDALKEGVTTDTFGGQIITIEKSAIGEVRMFNENGKALPYIGGFWFSWLAVHSETLLFK